MVVPGSNALRLPGQRAVVDRDDLSLDTPISALVGRHDNDYSRFEPFHDATPIGTSVVIPCFNHVDLLAQTLQALAVNPELRTHPDHFELIVVDDGSQEDVQRAVAGVELPVRCRIIRLDQNSGATQARNTGLAHASKELVVFLDSDVVIPANYFAEHWKIHNAVPLAVSVGFAHNISGGSEQSSDLPHRQPDITQDFRYFNSSLHRILPLKEPLHFVRDSDWFKHFSSAFAGSLWSLSEMVVSHNLAVRREHALRAGGFDARFTEWGSEDTFFGSVMIALGAYVIPLRESGVFRIRHNARNSSEEERIVQGIRSTLKRHRFESEPLSAVFSPEKAGTTLSAQHSAPAR